METLLDAPKPEKLTAKKLVPMTPSFLRRLNRVAAKTNADAAEIVRRGTAKELDLLDSVTAQEATRLEKLKQLAAARGGAFDMDAFLDQMLQQVRQPELPLAPTEP